jgi:exonuclease SbcC
MKILNVRLKNLNSLVGEWFIDFTHPSYIDSGIFAITGPTGAGKTTILDAICLALYGETPRLDSVSQSNNEIMSRGVTECSAEIHFETQKGRYRCTWQQRRARDRSDGRLQPPQHELVDVETNLPISKKLSEVKREVEQLTGLDFDRFTRSMLLAQGRFAAFLQSTANERAPILEQITGTEIYSNISIAVFQHAKNVGNELDRLKAEAGGIEMLSIEQIAQLEAELTETQIASDHAKALIAGLVAQIQWLQRLQQLQAQISQEEQNQATLNAEILAFEPDKKRLERDSLARQLDIAAAELRAVRERWERANADANQIRSRLPDLERSHTEKQQQHVQVSDQLRQKRIDREQILPLLIRVRELDADVVRRRENLHNLKSEIDGLQARLQQLSDEIAQHRSNLDTATEQRASLETYLTENAQDAILVEQFAGIESDICTWVSHLNDLSRKKTDRNTLGQRCDAAQLRIATETQDLELKQKALRDAEEVLTSGNARLEELLQGKLLREHESTRDHLIEKKRLRSIIKSLEQHRADLSPGEPCPLCGATEHPYATISLPTPDELDAEIDAVKTLIRSVNDQTELNRKQSEAVQTNRTKAAVAESLLSSTRELAKNLAEQARQQDNEIQVTEGRLESLRSALLVQLTPFGFLEITEENETDLLDHLSERRDRWQREQQSKAELESKIANIKSDIQTREATSSEIQNSLMMKSEQLRTQQREIDEQVSIRDRLFGDKNPESEEHRTLEEIERLEGALTSATNQLQVASDALTTATTSLANFVELATVAQNQLAELEPAFAASRLALGFAEETELYDARLEDALRDRLARIVQELGNRKYNIEQSIAQKQEDLRSESDRKLTERSLDVLQSASTTLEQENEQRQRRIGEIQYTITRNTESQSRLNEKVDQIAKQQIESDRWENLNELIGSADGKKYRNFVQALTFERLIHFANLQLSNMTDRYLLLPDDKEPLSLNVIDKFHAGAIRTTKNLSGGESFIVSLALALGLSGMASQKVRVDSLFLDEGFGTLDEEALDVALNTLSDLHQAGKLIGVISHVSALKERISTQIKVSPIGAGRSRINGPGCQLVARA